MQKQQIFKELAKRLKEKRNFAQVILGPRQVGKTTLVLQIKDKINIFSHYASADTATLKNLSWLESNWELARQKIPSKKEALLILDEIQKIPNWSEMIKKLWDEDTKNKTNLKVIILGSFPWLMQKGLTESLTGRFEILNITHWNFLQMQKIFGFNLDQFIYFGGYPGPANFVKQQKFLRWKNYINNSLIETTISRDILLMTQINKPILLRRFFHLGCAYSSQILSYQKMIGQLQDAGNTTTLSHYLKLLSLANILTGLNKYANQTFRKKASSPKFQVYNTALISAQSDKSFKEAKKDKEFWGHLVESCVGAHLLNEAKGKNIEIYYFREKNEEVDFILKKGNFLTAIEVKNSHKKEKLSGLDAFKKAFNPNKTLVIGKNYMPLEKFLKTPIEHLVS